MKKVFSFVLFSIFLIALFAGCTNTAPQSIESEPTETENPYLSENVLPWKYDACAKAVQNGTMEYYFMYSDDAVIKRTDGSGTSYKWGDSCLIIFPHGETMLIDSGYAGYAPILTENLRRLGVRKIDYLLFSHSHHDHVGGAVSAGGVLENFEIGKVYYPAVDQNYDFIAECIADSLTPEDHEPLIAGDTRKFGDVTMTVLWPMPEHQGITYSNTDDVNDMSLVVRLEYKDHSSLFTGDIYRNLTIDGVLHQHVEEQLVEYYLQQGKRELIDVDLLKVPHHGGSTSSGGKLLNTATPKLSIATGYEEIIDGVKLRYGDYMLLSDRECGYIHVTADGAGLLSYECSRYQ